MQIKKKAYVVPQLTVHGDIEVITQGNSDGDSTDKAFPINTPKKILTFS